MRGAAQALALRRDAAPRRARAGGHRARPPRGPRALEPAERRPDPARARALAHQLPAGVRLPTAGVRAPPEGGVMENPVRQITFTNELRFAKPRDEVFEAFLDTQKWFQVSYRSEEHTSELQSRLHLV